MHNPPCLRVRTGCGAVQENRADIAKWKHDLKWWTAADYMLMLTHSRLSEQVNPTVVNMIYQKLNRHADAHTSGGTKKKAAKGAKGGNNTHGGSTSCAFSWTKTELSDVVFAAAERDDIFSRAYLFWLTFVESLTFVEPVFEFS
jgi:hypothetical protein